LGCRQIPQDPDAGRTSRSTQRAADVEQFADLAQQFKAAREERGLSLSDMTELTGMDRSSISRLETEQRANPTVETLARSVRAVGKRLVVSLRDA
jgi:DNA-binding XRE family transcriptional regulator